MDVIPDGSLQVGAVQRRERRDAPEPVIQQVTDVRVQSVDQGEAVDFPGVILKIKIIRQIHQMYL